MLAKFFRTSEVRKMKEKIRKGYVTEKMESQQKNFAGFSQLGPGEMYADPGGYREGTDRVPTGSPQFAFPRFRRPIPRLPAELAHAAPPGRWRGRSTPRPRGSPAPRRRGPRGSARRTPCPPPCSPRPASCGSCAIQRRHPNRSRPKDTNE